MKTICEKETEKSTHDFACLSAVNAWKSGKNRSDIISISLLQRFKERQENYIY